MEGLQSYGFREPDRIPFCQVLGIGCGESEGEATVPKVLTGREHCGPAGGTPNRFDERLSLSSSHQLRQEETDLGEKDEDDQGHQQHHKKRQ